MDEKKKNDSDSEKKAKISKILKYTALGVGIVAGAALPVLALPAIISVAGFGAGGILAGSFGATMMSWSATYGVGAGVVAFCQSVGAAGMAAGTAVGLGAAGGVVGGAVGGLVGKKVADATTPGDGTDSDGDKEPSNDTASDENQGQSICFEKCTLVVKEGDEVKMTTEKVVVSKVGSGSQSRVVITAHANPDRTLLEVTMSSVLGVSRLDDCQIQLVWECRSPLKTAGDAVKHPATTAVIQLDSGKEADAMIALLEEKK